MCSVVLLLLLLSAQASDNIKITLPMGIAGAVGVCVSLCAECRLFGFLVLRMAACVFVVMSGVPLLSGISNGIRYIYTWLVGDCSVVQRRV